MWALSEQARNVLMADSLAWCGRFRAGDAEPLNGERLSSWVVHWERSKDGKWRPVNAPGSDSAYTWDKLVAGFGELRLVTGDE